MVQIRVSPTLLNSSLLAKKVLRYDICGILNCLRPYHVEHTSSRPITEVKQH
jgi:hypothetical protein